MTSLFDHINEAIKIAMIARNKIELETLRSIKKEFVEAKTAKGANGELSDETAFKILQKMTKQRQDSAQIYKDNGRFELAEAELAEAEIIGHYLPQQLSLQEILPIVRRLMKDLTITDPKQIGRVIGAAQKELQGRADGKIIADAVKHEFANLIG